MCQINNVNTYIRSLESHFYTPFDLYTPFGSPIRDTLRFLFIPDNLPTHIVIHISYINKPVHRFNINSRSSRLVTMTNFSKKFWMRVIEEKRI